LLPLGIEAAPHDCGRTFAKLALKGGARLVQIQLNLGHATIRTTERYLGVEQDLTDAPCAELGSKLSSLRSRVPPSLGQRPQIACKVGGATVFW
jgi:hypothetical protein